MLTATAIGLITLGGTGLTGWITRQPLLVGLLPGFPTMVISTSLMFAASGLAMLALTRHRRRVASLLGAGILALAVLILVEHLFGLDLGIDLKAVHSWAADGFLHPGRPARATALCFVLAGITFLTLAAPYRPWQAPLVLVLALTILLMGLGAGLGGLLRLDTLYPSYLLRGMSIPTTIGMLGLGACLAWISASDLAAQTPDSADRRIISIGTALLVAVALVTGIPILYVVRSQVDQAMISGLRTALSTEVQLIGAELTLRMQRAEIVSNRPLAIETLRSIHRDPDDAEALGILQDTVESSRPHGFSAVRVSLPGGRVVASSGAFTAQPELYLPLDSTAANNLGWKRGYFLRSRFEIQDAGLLLATVDTEQLMPQIGAVVETATSLGRSGDLEICQKRASTVHCFPSTRREHPLGVAFSADARANLLMRAAAGGTGIHNGRDGSGEPVIGAYAPVESHGLFVVLKVQAGELYGPLRRSMEIALGLATVMVIAGSLLFRALVKPIASELVKARESASQKNRELVRVHAFQRAIFEQAPDGIVVSDESGRIVEANERMGRLFGYARETLKELQIEDLVPLAARSEHQRHRQAYHESPTTRPMGPDRPLQGRRADGSEFPIEVALAPMAADGARRVIAIVKDVTESRRAEQQIRDSLREKNVLLGEIHHRVKNNLQIVQSLLDMQVALTPEAATAGVLKDCQNRIQSMALIHQTLYQSHDFAGVDFGQFLESLMSHLQGSYGHAHIHLSSRSDHVSLPIDRAIPCGLIVNELVTNALKHAFPQDRAGRILVEMTLLRGDDVEIAVSDDGIGFPPSFELSNLSSLGMQLVQVLSEQLHAELHIRRRDPTRIALTFPCTRPSPHPSRPDRSQA